MASSDGIAQAERHRRLIEAIGRNISSFVTLIGTVVIMLTATELLIGAGFWLNKVRQSPIDQAAGAGSRADLPVFRDAPEDRRYIKENVKMHFEPYYHWRRDKFESKYVNVDASGLRKTVKSPAAGAAKVFVFGGSTVWGSGVADAYTIPSLLQQRLGSAYDVYNFGETAFVSAQEFNLLLRELAFGNVPDVVIFYDGFNDGYAGAYSPAIPRDPHNERIRRQNQFKPFLQQLVGRTNTYALVELVRGGFGKESTKHAGWDQSVAPHVPDNAKEVLDVYEQFVVQAKAVGNAYRFKVFFFWQPHLLTGTRNVQPYEKEIVESQSPALIEAMGQVHREAARRLSQRENSNVFFLGHVFDDVDEPTYVDWCHLGPRGNDVIAEEMFKRLRGKI